MSYLLYMDAFVDKFSVPQSSLDNFFHHSTVSVCHTYVIVLPFLCHSSLSNYQIHSTGSSYRGPELEQMKWLVYVGLTDKI